MGEIESIFKDRIMTAMSRQRTCGILAAAVSCGMAVAAGWAFPAISATTERIVTDRHSGFAISGFDPVAYFTEAVPRQGRREHEYAHESVTWRFRNEGNLAAFAANPKVYMPQLGGYDAVSAARGVAAPGHPALFLIHERRLYLFYSPESRDEFAADPDGMSARALDRWPDILKTLTP
jgi:hypothetical protein